MSLYIYNKAISFELPDNIRLVESADDDEVCSHLITKNDTLQDGQAIESIIGKVMDIYVSAGNNELDSYREVFRAIADYYAGSKYFITPSPYECMIINIPVVFEGADDNKSSVVIVVPDGNNKMACILMSCIADVNENEIFKNVLTVANAITINNNSIPISSIKSNDLKEALKLSYSEKASVDISSDIFTDKKEIENQVESDIVNESDSVISFEADKVCTEDDNNSAIIAKEREKVRIKLIDAKLELSRAEKKVESNNESIKTDKASLDEKKKAFADYIDLNMADLEYNKSHITSEQIKQRSLIKELEAKKSEAERELEKTKKDLEGISFFKFSLKKELNNRIEKLGAQIKECHDSIMIEKTKLDALDSEFKTRVISHQQNIDEMEKDIDALEERVRRLTVSNDALAKTIEIKSMEVVELDNELKSL